TQVELIKIVLTCLQIFRVIFGYIRPICGYLKAILWRELTPIRIPFFYINRY
ncbi:hypothetical protein C1646_728466, partial [Rhizophagus diaphanus]